MTWFTRPLGPRGRIVLNSLVYAVLGCILFAIAWPDIPSEFREMEGVVRKVETRKIHVYVRLAGGQTVCFLLGQGRLRELPQGEMAQFMVVAVPPDSVVGRTYTGVAAKCGQIVYYSEAKYWAVHRFYKYGAGLALLAGTIALVYLAVRRLRAIGQDAKPLDGSAPATPSEGDASATE